MRRRDDWTARALAAASTPLLPLWAAASALHPRLRGDLRERWGLDVAPIQPGVVWVHASSVGEVGSAAALIARLSCPILLTADTDTGAAAARRVAERIGPQVVASVRPVDHPWLLAPLWAAARPRALVFVEGTWWPQLAARAAREGVPIMRVSAKVGPATKRLASVGLRRPLTDLAGLVVARDTASALFFQQQGAPVVVGGDLKADRIPGRSPLSWSRPFVVAASTRAGDERALLDALPQLSASPQALLAPRHPRRFDEVAALLAIRGLRFVRRSTLLDGVVPASADVVLLDTMGELGDLFVGASAAFIGGTFDRRLGGHSPWEARSARVPIVCGPHTHGQGSAFASAHVAQSPADLGAALQRAMEAPTPPSPVGAAALTAGWVLERLAPTAAEASPRPWLKPVAPIFAAASLGWTALHLSGARRAERVGVPVICVGSTQARGPGRTSTVAWVAREARRRGHVVGIAVRGYRRTEGGAAVFVSDEHPAASHLGDEGALHAWRGFLVAAAPDRVAAAHALVERGCTIVVLDDGLQHHRLARDVDLVVLDGRRLGAAGVLPAGERREWTAVPHRATGVILHHSDRLWDGLASVRARRVLGPWHRGSSPTDLPEGPLAAFAGVARPGDVRASLPARPLRFRALADHAPVSRELADELVEWAEGRPLLCTAKDRVRLPSPLRDSVYWRDLEVVIDDPIPSSWFPPVVSRD